MNETISPICGTYLGEPQMCNVEAVAAVEAGRQHFDTRHADTPTPAVLALVLALGVACVVLSMPTRRNGRRAK